jgi:hypothetical protein
MAVLALLFSPPAFLRQFQIKFEEIVRRTVEHDAQGLKVFVMYGFCGDGG